MSCLSLGSKRLQLEWGGFGFALKAGKHLVVFGDISGKKLQSDKAIEFDVLGLVHNTHTATTEFLDDAVMRDGLADERIGNCHVRFA